MREPLRTRLGLVENPVFLNLDPLLSVAYIGGFEKGLAGGGWRQTNPPKEPKSSSEMCPHSPKGA